jgi:hypothetical protein
VGVNRISVETRTGAARGQRPGVLTSFWLKYPKVTTAFDSVVFLTKLMDGKKRAKGLACLLGAMWSDQGCTVWPPS